MRATEGDAPRHHSHAPRPLRRLPRGWALAVLLTLLLALGWSALTATSTAPANPPVVDSRATAEGGDFSLYSRIAVRVAAGEGYYAAALAEQRAGNYPTRPFVTVRLPTLAWANALLGQEGTGILAITLLFATILAWQRALADGTLLGERIGATVLIFLCGYSAFEPRAGLVHELVAGLLLSLALALYRRDRWWPSLLALALALSVRELALPFALLWFGFAVLEKRRQEAIAVALVVALFAIGLALHYLAIENLRLPGDRASPGWDALLGPQVFLHALHRLTPLLFLPAWLAAPLALLPLFGWVALGGRLGLFAALWFAGFAMLMAIFARAENFYWAMMVLPAYGTGLAFVPRGLAHLGAALRRRGAA